MRFVRFATRQLGEQAEALHCLFILAPNSRNNDVDVNVEQEKSTKHEVQRLNWASPSSARLGSFYLAQTYFSFSRSRPRPRFYPPQQSKPAMLSSSSALLIDK